MPTFTESHALLCFHPLNLMHVPLLANSNREPHGENVLETGFQLNWMDAAHFSPLLRSSSLEPDSWVHRLSLP